MHELETFLVSSDISIKQALKKMDAAGRKILFIADNDRKLSGVVTDGDIRRWILKGEGLDFSVERIMNKKPVVLEEGFDGKKAKELMLSLLIDCIPVLDAEKKIVSAIWWTDLFDKKEVKKKAVDNPVVIMAGGEGTRLSPFTHAFPKPLLPIGGKPIIELIIERFAEFGCSDFYLSVNYKANILKAYFSEVPHSYNISYIEENKPLGTIGSLSLLKKEIDKTFFVSNCDILIEADYADILKFHKDNSCLITLVVSMKHYRIPYGICKIENGGMLKEITEKPEYDFLVNTGMYLMEPSVLHDIPENMKYDTTELINDYIKRDKKIGVYPVSDKSWLDIGQWQQLQETVKKIEEK